MANLKMVSIEVIKKRVKYYLKDIDVRAFCKLGEVFGKAPYMTCEVLLRTGPWKRVVAVLDVQETGWVTKDPSKTKLLRDVSDAIWSALKYFVNRGIIEKEEDIYYVIWVVENRCPSDPTVLRKGLSTFLKECLFKGTPIKEIMDRLFREIVAYPMPFQERMILPYLLSAYATHHGIPFKSLTELDIDKVAAMYGQILEYLYLGLKTELPDDLKRFSRIMRVSLTNVDWSFFLPSLHKPRGVSILELVIILSLVWSAHFGGRISARR